MLVEEDKLAYQQKLECVMARALSSANQAWLQSRNKPLGQENGQIAIAIIAGKIFTELVKVEA